MVLFFTSTATSPPSLIYMGKDKVENEELIRFGLKNDVWFHVDKLSSAHVYLRLPGYITWDAIPEKLLIDLGQLVKANSIEGNKKNNVTIIYTPHENLKKSGDMATGAVSFFNDKLVKRVYIPTRENAIVNRLLKTKVVKEVDHEAERIERLRDEGRGKKAKANELKNAALELQRSHTEQKNARSYDALFSEENGYVADAPVTKAKPKSKPRYNSDGEEIDGSGGSEGGDGGGSDDDFW
ncbi:DUF814-domain-containing protein [Mrakia frigida]|uniref:Jlp2p n=1 Tax=Mrakia frigida TaxID=29902 RepID=UPI003FCBF2EA